MSRGARQAQQRHLRRPEMQRRHTRAEPASLQQDSRLVGDRQPRSPWKQGFCERLRRAVGRSRHWAGGRLLSAGRGLALSAGGGRPGFGGGGVGFQ